MIAHNPYPFGVPVWQDGEFFGRESLLLEASMLLGDRRPTAHLQIWGPKRIGKTSLLHRIRQASSPRSRRSCSASRSTARPATAYRVSRVPCRRRRRFRGRHDS